MYSIYVCIIYIYLYEVVCMFVCVSATCKCKSAASGTYSWDMSVESAKIIICIEILQNDMRLNHASLLWTALLYVFGIVEHLYEHNICAKCEIRCSCVCACVYGERVRAQGRVRVHQGAQGRNPIYSGAQ